MGVLACDREGCENIMCSYISHDHSAYLCDSCMADLQQFLDSGGADIAEFLRSKKGATNPKGLKATDFFKPW